VTYRSLTVPLAVLCVTTGAQAQSPRPAATAHVIVGELVRVDLVDRLLGVRPEGPELRETMVAVGPDVLVTSRGRRLSLHELRTGERVTIACTDDGPRHRARLVKVGSRPAAIPSPR